ncbi:hypothetical protein GQ42DRAFT_162101 [Ramicandelaber brevisporus]|nr:hypothetical protein GQ42DRAFT_162101 [Ramicandelaber brevisporus]
MKKTARSEISGTGVDVRGIFTNEHDSILAKIQLSTPADYQFDGLNATLEYDNVTNLNGEFKIGEDSEIGPDRIRLLLKNGFGKEATILIILKHPLPSGLSRDGTVDFYLPE